MQQSSDGHAGGDLAGDQIRGGPGVIRAVLDGRREGSAVASGALDPTRRPDLTDTAPTDRIGPHPQWFEPERIVSLDPFGAVVADVFSAYLAEGYDIRPTIAVTKAATSVSGNGQRQQRAWQALEP